MGTDGWRAGGYVAEELLGYGASGEVWRGRASRGGAAVALKVLHLADDSALRAARAEAALLSVLDHPNLIRLHELVARGDDAVLVLDLAHGGSLADLLDRRGRLTAGEVVSALAPVAAALAYAHEQGVVHADVSAANILFTGDAAPLLADLGVARLMGGVEPVRSTLAYLDPAVAAGGAAGPASDVFMLAGVTLHALTGRPPWAGSTAEEIIDLAAGGEVVGLEDLLTPLPTAVAEVVRRGLSAAPHGRGTAAEFALDLRHAATPVPVELSAGRPTFTGPVADRSPAPRGPVHAPRHALARPAPERPGSGRAGLVRPASADVVYDRPPFIRPGNIHPGNIHPGNMPAEPAALAASSLASTHTIRARVQPAVAPAGRWSIRPRTRTLCGIGVAATSIALLGGAGVARAMQADRPRHVATLPAPPRTGSPQAGGAAQPGGDAQPAGPTRSEPRSASDANSPAEIPAAAASAAAASVPAASVPAAPVSVPAPAPRSPLGAPPARPVGPAAWRSILQEVDHRRERAFATRDPAALASVYTSAALVGQDRATLHRVVPRGCGLHGLSTEFGSVRVTSRSADATVLRVVAGLPSATLTCAGVPSSRTRARAGIVMSVTVERRGTEYAISDQSVR